MLSTEDCRLALLCIDCPTTGSRTPPFVAFAPLITTHHRAHVRARPTHRLLLWCRTEGRFHGLRSRRAVAVWQRSSGLTLLSLWRSQTPAMRSCACGCLVSLGPLPEARALRSYWRGQAALAVVGDTGHTMTSGRGGRRPGAGAKAGNTNARKHGRYSVNTDAETLAILSYLPPELQRKASRLLRASGETIKGAVDDQTPGNVVDLYGSRARTSRTSIPPSPPPAEQSNPFINEIVRLDGYGFRNAAAFVRRHHRYAWAIGDALDYADTQEAPTDVRNAAGLIRDDVHLRIGEPRGAWLRCPACPWQQLQFNEETEDTGS